MNNEEFFDKLDRIIEDFIALIQGTIKQLWNTQNFNLSLKNEYQVLFGLLSRQVTLSIRFVNAYSFWNHDMAPIIMRCLADNLINLKWIVGDVSERSDRFVKFGLGQEKLNIEHRKVQLEKDGKDPQADPVIQAQERWLSTFRFPMITWGLGLEYQPGRWQLKRIVWISTTTFICLSVAQCIVNGIIY